jgi:hypothetical protein
MASTTSFTLPQPDSDHKLSIIENNGPLTKAGDLFLKILSD